MLESMYAIILVSTLLVLVAAFSSLLASRFGAPLLLLFLSIGLLAGEDGLGLHFDNAVLAYFVGSLALAVILFDSGFGTSLQSLRNSAAPALMLATAGVWMTAALFGVAAAYVLDIPLMKGILLGAIVGSTDAAAVFFLLHIGGIHIRDSVRATLEIESGSNDPMAVFLTLALVELVKAGSTIDAVGFNVLFLFLEQIVLGILFGIGGGWIIKTLINRLHLERGLTPIFALALSLLVFSATGLVDGSGFLAVYVAGLYAGNSRLRAGPSLKTFQEGMTWLAQIIMFLVLGLLATPSRFPAIAGQAIALAAFLILVARPIAVFLALLPFDFNKREKLFISWVGLRGAVSILLAILPLIGGLDQNQTLFNVAFIIVLASLLVQGWTIGLVARWLDLIVPARIGPVEKFELELPGTANHELLSYRVVAGSPVARGERLPRWARPSLVMRDGKTMRFQYAGRLKAGDYVYLFISSRYPRLLDRLFASPVQLRPDDIDFFGEFTVDPAKPARHLGAAYGIAIDPDMRDASIAEMMTALLGGHAEYGDRVPIGPVELIVRDTDEEGRIVEAGLSLDRETPRAEPFLLRKVRRALRRVRATFGRPTSGPPTEGERKATAAARTRRDEARADLAPADAPTPPPLPHPPGHTVATAETTAPGEGATAP